MTPNTQIHHSPFQSKIKDSLFSLSSIDDNELGGEGGRKNMWVCMLDI